MKRSEKLFGVDGDALALEILLDGTLTEEARQKKLSEVYKKFSETVNRKIKSR